MSSYFYEKPDKILQWLRAKGYTGTFSDAMLKYAKDNSSIAQGSMFDHLNASLTRAGYSEADLNDKLTTMFQAKTGVSNRKDAERKFFQDNNLQMFSSGVDQFTVLMLHMNGTNGGTTFTDSATTPKTVTAVGAGTVTSTTQIKFGSASGSFPASGDHLTIPDSSDFNFGSGDFTIDTWFYQTAAPAVAGSIFISDTTNTTSNIYIRVDTSRQVYADFNGGSGGGGWGVLPGAGTVVALNAWTHVALVRSGTNFSIYINGVSGASATNASAITDQATTRAIGGVDVGGGDRNIIGFLDEFRISKGIARWTSNFTPPTQEYS